jgi:methionyl-tRNA synthetase
MSKTDWLITTTPPTPNGDRLGEHAVSVCYGDDHQSYVVTTARRLGVAPEALMAEANDDIRATLAAYAAAPDLYYRPDPAHDRTVAEAFARLIDAGMIVERPAVWPLDPATGIPLYEAFAGGTCPMCLLGTKGGICEACGHPNDPVDLLGPAFGTTLADGPTATGRHLVLPIEPWRAALVDFYADKRGLWRPHLIQLVDELLMAPLADYPISHPGDWGIPVPAPGWDGHVLNVWAEMGVGLLHALDRAGGEGGQAEGRLVQFLGYDNSYFFAVVHPVLQFALEAAGAGPGRLPHLIVTNEFYNLDNRKFSTSQGHALWGRDLLARISRDEARFYLALNGPERAEANFSLDAALAAIERDVRRPLATVAGRVRVLGPLAGPTIDADPLPWLDGIAARFDFFSRPAHFSTAELARIVGNLLRHLAEVPVAETPAGAAAFVSAVRFWADRAGVIMPDTAADMAALTRGAPEPVAAGAGHGR